MELKRLCICLAFFVLAYISQCSDARHSMDRRDVEDVNYDDVLADEATDDEAQNDAEGNDADEEDEVVASVITQPSVYSPTIGRNVRLECKVSPPDGVVVQWTRNSTKYFLGTMKSFEQDLNTYGVGDRYSIAPNSTDLLIRDIQPSDSGSYVCEVLQFERSQVNHTVVVLESPRVIKLSATDNGQVLEGSDLLLTCEVSGSPPPKIVWSRDGVNGNERLQEKDGKFEVNSVYIKNVKREHSGKYYCYAFNNVGANQAEIKVVVRGKPRVHVHRTVVNSAINVEAVLQCTVHDEPTSNIRWYKDGQRIDGSSHQYNVSTNGAHSNLYVVPENDQDFGTFTCEAENDLGTHNRSIDLVQSPVVENLDVDGSKLSWTIHSHQPVEQIEVQLREAAGDGEWRTVTVPVPEGRHHEYEIVYNLDDLDSGKYEATIKVKNEKSWSANTDTALVEIEARPEYIQHASVYRGNGFSIKPSTFALSTTLMYLLVRM